MYVKFWPWEWPPYGVSRSVHFPGVRPSCHCQARRGPTPSIAGLVSITNETLIPQPPTFKKPQKWERPTPSFKIRIFLNNTYRLIKPRSKEFPLRFSSFPPCFNRETAVERALVVLHHLLARRSQPTRYTQRSTSNRSNFLHRNSG